MTGNDLAMSLDPTDRSISSDSASGPGISFPTAAVYGVPPPARGLVQAHRGTRGVLPQPGQAQQRARLVATREMVASVALLLPLLYMCLAASSSPLPPRQTPLQQHIFAEHAAEAAAASPRATASVLEAFGAPDFRAALQRCCPTFAALSPVALLDEFREQMAVIEIIHNFHPVVNESGSDHRPNSADVTLSMLRDARYLVRFSVD